jgi:alpha-L-fucosidase 2
METISICGTAMQEMMLQSNEGKIRVFPAVPSGWRDATLAFKLLARGGFLVASQCQKGVVEQVGIKSHLGGRCRLQNPWPGQASTVTALTTGAVVDTRVEAGDVLAFETVPGAEYIVRGRDAPVAVRKAAYSSEPNKEPKVLNAKRTLGLGKGFLVEK